MTVSVAKHLCQHLVLSVSWILTSLIEDNGIIVVLVCISLMNMMLNISSHAYLPFVYLLS